MDPRASHVPRRSKFLPSFKTAFASAFMACPTATRAAAKTLASLEGNEHPAQMILFIHDAVCRNRIPMKALEKLVRGDPGYDDCGNENYVLLAELYKVKEVLLNFLKNLDVFHFLELCNTSKYVRKLAERNKGSLCFPVASKAWETLPRINLPVPGPSTAEIADLINFKNTFLAAVTVEMYGISAADPIGDKVRADVSRGWEIVTGLSMEWRAIDKDYSTDSIKTNCIQDLNTIKRVYEARRLWRIVNDILGHCDEEQECLYTLLRCLVSNTSSTFQVPSGSAHREISPELWRLWVIKAGPEPFFRAWTGNLNTGGSFLRDVEDTFMVGGSGTSGNTMATGDWLMAAVNSWYMGFEERGYGREISALVGLPSYPRFFNDITYPVYKW